MLGSYEYKRVAVISMEIRNDIKTILSKTPALMNMIEGPDDWEHDDYELIKEYANQMKYIESFFDWMYRTACSRHDDELNEEIRLAELQNEERIVDEVRGT